MKKVKALFFNGSPRRNWSTHKALEKAMEGAREAGAETRLYHLYDYSNRGCLSCFSCKLKEDRTHGLCALWDEMTPVLEDTLDADVIVIGSPVYVHSQTAMTRAFLERLLYPIITYWIDEKTGRKVRYLDRTVFTGFIYTMNNSAQTFPDRFYDKIFGKTKDMMQYAYGHHEVLNIYDTYQFSDYTRYVCNQFDEKKKAYVRETQFPQDLEKAYEMGKRLTEMAAAE